MNKILQEKNQSLAKEVTLLRSQLNDRDRSAQAADKLSSEKLPLEDRRSVRKLKSNYEIKIFLLGVELLRRNSQIENYRKIFNKHSIKVDPPKDQ
jgi:hypothetical protein